MSTRSSVFRDMAAKHQRELAAKQATSAFASDLVKLRAAMTSVEGNNAEHYARLRKGCHCLMASIRVWYHSAADFKAGKPESSELEVSAIRPFRYEHEPIYFINLDPNNHPFLLIADWPGNEVEGEGEQFEYGELDTDLIEALWELATEPLAA